MKFIFSIFSGIIIGISYRFPSLTFLVWAGFIPLFFALQNTKLKNSIVLGLISGLASSFFMLIWIVPTVSNYMGESIFGGLLAFLLIAFLYAIKFALFTFLYRYLMKSVKQISFLHILLIPAIWTGLEYLNTISTTTFPWITSHLGYLLACYPKFIQSAELTGVFGISFLIIVVNYAFYLFIKTRKPSFLISGISVLALQFLIGWLMMANLSDDGRKVKVAIIQENIPAQMRWDKSLADSIVEHYYLSALREAVNFNPDIILWSETAVPWKLHEDDHLVYEALKITWPSQAGHILGIHSEVKGKQDCSYNSAFYIQPNGDITGEYDKTYPLTFLESPLINSEAFGNWMLPFFKESLQNIEPGTRSNVLKTPYGKVGMSICNESVLGFHTRKPVNEGANFLMVMSNDAWFVNTQFPRYHFSHSVLRAVENRRDIAVNSNGGYAGFVDASGEVISHNKSDEPAMVQGVIKKRSHKTFYTRHGDVFAIGCIFLLLLYLAITFVKNKSKTKSL